MTAIPELRRLRQENGKFNYKLHNMLEGGKRKWRAKRRGSMREKREKAERKGREKEP